MNYILGDLIERNISVQVLVSLLIVLVAIAGIDLIFLFFALKVFLTGYLI